VKILFIISSSIAAKKCESIIKLLVDNKIEIKIILTENSKKMINISKLKKITNGKIYTDNSEKNNKMLHIDLSRKANLVVVCPATANTIAKFANGYGDNLASTTLLASNKQIIFVPAMNVQMWNNKINQKNIKFLKDNGIEFVGPQYGKLYCGEKGFGRLANEKLIVNTIIKNLKLTKIFKGKQCLVTAGPTIEEIDPIRYISNYSSGKQGYEIAEQLVLSGAKVTLISGPTNLSAPNKVKLIKIKTADDMFKEVKKIKNIDIGIFASAVSDFKPKNKFNSKINKNDIKKIEVKKNIDILKYIGTLRKNRPKLVIGFAAETENIQRAVSKLNEKKCDLIIYNNINNSNKVFGSNYNKITLITKYKKFSFPKMSKAKCAKKIISTVNNLYFN